MMLPLDVFLNLPKKDQEFVLKVYEFTASLMLVLMFIVGILGIGAILTLPFILF